MIREKKELKDLDLLDRFLFAEATEDPEILELMLEIILGKDIVLQEKPQAEKEIRKNLWSKKVRLDVLSKDQAEEIYNAEAQKINTGSLPKRSRYYNSIIDSKLLDVGETDYNKLNNVTVILVAPFDLFGEGLYKYTFRMKCEEKPAITLNDGATRIFLNTRGVNGEGVSEELIELLHFIERTDAETASLSSSSKVHRIHEKIEAIKKNEEVGVRFMNAWEEQCYNKEEGRREGRIEGQKESTSRIAKKMKDAGEPVEKIIQFTELTESEIEKL